MERTRFSFRRKGSQKNNKADKETEGTGGTFDYDTLSYVSQKEAKAMEEELLKEYAFTPEQTIEISGLTCATAIAQTYSIGSLTKGKGSILVCCGPGRNGAEGLVCARHLKLFGYRPTVFYAKPPAGVPLYASLAVQCEKNDIPNLLYLPSDAQLVTDAYNLIVDAIFDHSYDPPTTPDYAVMLQTIIRSKVPVVSIAVPSGWHVNGNHSESDIDNLLQPEMLISLPVPLFCAKNFKGKYHILGGRYLPAELSKKFCLTLPPYSGSELWTELKMTAMAGAGLGGGVIVGVDGLEKCGGGDLKGRRLGTPLRDVKDDPEWGLN